MQHHEQVTTAAPEAPTPALRMLRALLVAGIAFSIGTLGHAAAGGLLPGAPTLVGLFGILVVATALALARPASYAVVAALVVGGQLVVHTVLTAMSGHPGGHQEATRELARVAPGGVRAQLSVVDVTPQVTVGPVVPDWLQHLLDDLTGANLAMGLVHAGAALVMAGWLFLGERALTALLLMLDCRLELALAMVSAASLGATPDAAPIHSTGSLGAMDRLGRLRRAATRGNAARRGPPLGLLHLHPSPTT